MLENNHYQMAEKEYVNKRTIGRALEELDKGLITVISHDNT